MFARHGKLKNCLKISTGLLLILIGAGCSHLHPQSNPQSNPQDKFMMANLYYQQAPEIKALYYQGYNAAKDYLSRKKIKNSCVVMDIDETVLDNSPYQGWLHENKESYSSKTWEAWVAKEEAPAVPGAVSFINFARKRGIRVYFITNRKAHLKEATLNNLRKEKIKLSPSDLVGRTNTSSKVERRQQFTKNCQLVLLAGDSLADFHERFEGDVNEREKGLHELKDKWGREYIIFPNPMYGDWTRKEAKKPLKSFQMD